MLLPGFGFQLGEGGEVGGAADEGLFEAAAVLFDAFVVEVAGDFKGFAPVEFDAAEGFGDDEGVPGFGDAPAVRDFDADGDDGQSAHGGGFDDAGVAFVARAFGAVGGDAHAAAFFEFAHEVHEAGDAAAVAGAADGAHAVVFSDGGKHGAVFAGAGEHAHGDAAFEDVFVEVAGDEGAVVPEGDDDLAFAHVRVAVVDEAFAQGAADAPDGQPQDVSEGA